MSSSKFKKYEVLLEFQLQQWNFNLKVSKCFESFELKVLRTWRKDQNFTYNDGVSSLKFQEHEEETQISFVTMEL
jgi:hypothetical protein